MDQNKKAALPFMEGDQQRGREYRKQTVPKLCRLRRHRRSWQLGRRISCGEWSGQTGPGLLDQAGCGGLSWKIGFRKRVKHAAIKSDVCNGSIVSLLLNLAYGEIRQNL